MLKWNEHCNENKRTQYYSRFLIEFVGQTSLILICSGPDLEAIDNNFAYMVSEIIVQV